jgi:hypothetical protein
MESVTPVVIIEAFRYENEILAALIPDPTTCDRAKVLGFVKVDQQFYITKPEFDKVVGLIERTKGSGFERNRVELPANTLRPAQPPSSVELVPVEGLCDAFVTGQSPQCAVLPTLLSVTITYSSTCSHE